jgi:high-affinity iron transporter
MLGFFSMRYQEVKDHRPLMKAKNRVETDTRSKIESSAVEGGKTGVTEKSTEVAA